MVDLDVLKAAGIIFLVGCLGGLVAGLLDRPSEKCDNKIISKKYNLWPYYQDCNTLFPGLLLSIVLGGIAACIWWIINNSFSSVLVWGDVSIICESSTPSVTLGHIAASFLIGIGGTSYIITEAERRCASNDSRK